MNVSDMQLNPNKSESDIKLIRALEIVRYPGLYDDDDLIEAKNYLKAAESEAQVKANAKIELKRKTEAIAKRAIKAKEKQATQAITEARKLKAILQSIE